MHLPQLRFPRFWPILGASFCCFSAGLVSLVFRNIGFKTSVTLAFLCVVTWVAVRCGSAAGMVGTCISAAVFAFFFLPPLRSFAVADANQRLGLAWFLFGGVVISFLFGAATKEPAAKLPRK